VDELYKYDLQVKPIFGTGPAEGRISFSLGSNEILRLFDCGIWGKKKEVLIFFAAAHI
jgi:hypothetical protein